LEQGDDDRILGFTMIGSEAGEVVAEVQIAMLANLPYPKLPTPSSRTLRSPKGSGLFSRRCQLGPEAI
jgi:hypothetical protein